MSGEDCLEQRVRRAVAVADELVKRDAMFPYGYEAKWLVVFNTMMLRAEQFEPKGMVTKAYRDGEVSN